MNPYITAREAEKMKRATTYEKLGLLALGALERMGKATVPKPIGQVCGPITTGGLGSIEANLAEFSRWIEILQRRGLAIFDQIPFEEHLFRIWNQRDHDDQNNRELLEGFYTPILESGIVKTFYFIPGWSGSNGAMWEHREAVKLGITIDYL